MKIDLGAFWDFLAKALSAINQIDSGFKLLAFTLVLLVGMVIVLALIFRSQIKFVKWILSFTFSLFAMAMLFGFTAKAFAYRWHTETESVQEQLKELEGGAQALAPLETETQNFGQVSGIVIPADLSRNLASLIDRSNFYRDIGVRRVSSPAILAGRLAYFQKETQEAERLFTKARVLEASKEASNDLGVVSYAKGQLKEAAEHFQSALEIDSQFPNPMNGLGILAYQAGSQSRLSFSDRNEKLTEAINWFDQALGIDANYGRAINNRGLAYRELGRITSEPAEKLRHFRQAEAGFHEAARVLPETPEVRLNLGLVSENMGNEEQAIAHYREALVLNPSYAQVLNNLAMILATSESHRDPAEAIDLAKRATELNPEDPGYLDTLARAYLAGGRRQEALETGKIALEQAILLNKPYADQIESFLEQVPKVDGTS